jgi:N-hydroxyarylamine O-acetyltransferase
MQLSAYLKRIGYPGTPKVDFRTLAQIQRGHMEHIPYDALDVPLGIPVSLATEPAFSKLVKGMRGGWCYEMNGLFRWALEAIGFEVIPMTAAVKRKLRGDSALGNHLALLVRLDQDYLVDVGLADGPIEPIPFTEGVFSEDWREFRIERVDDEWWRFHNYENSSASSFDFRPNWYDSAVLERKCHWLQTDPDSTFVQNAICCIAVPDGYRMLVGRVLKWITKNGTSDILINNEAEYSDVLRTQFGLENGFVDQLWPGIVRRHDTLFPSLNATV